MKRTLTLVLCLWLAQAPAVGLEQAPMSCENDVVAQEESEKLLLRKAEELAAQMNGTLRVRELFDAVYFRYTSLAKTVEMLSRLHREYGRIASVRLETYDTPETAHFIFETEKSFLLPLALTVNRESGRISSMLFRTPNRKNLSLASIKEQFAALPGEAGFLAVKLNAPGAVLEALHSNDAMAISALSKLYILGAVQEKKYSWKKTLTLKEGARSLPPGRTRDWPAGSPATLHTLALGMIAENDNTAADMIADMVGRGDIEDLLPRLGHSAPELMTPFLKTADVFRLKSDTQSALDYMNASRAERYWLLDKIAGMPLSSVNYKPGPFAMDRIGWRASAADLCRLMDRLRTGEDRTARDILAVNPGLAIPGNRFDYAGYKGGAEPGVVGGAWLLMRENGDWYCLAGLWNNWRQSPDEKRFQGLMQSAVYAIGGQ